MNRSDDFADTGDPQPDGPSKSARKREAEALQTLGERLVGLPEAQLRQVPLPEDLAGAIAECRRISAHGGRYRQMQYIGKLMRRIDPQPILDVLARFDSTSAESKRRQHQLERWVEAMVAGDETVLGEYLTAYPQADRQQIRQLIRNAQRELSTGKPPKSRRELFRLLRGIAFRDEDTTDADPR